MLLESASKYSKDTCDRGFSLTVIWRGSSDKRCPGCLDIIINGLYLDTISYPGLAPDFFAQFINDDPVSEEAKLAFLNGYSNFLLTDSP